MSGELALERALRRAVEVEASDLHFAAGAPPMLRVHGALEPLGATPLTSAETEAAFRQLTSAEQQERFAREHDLDFAWEDATLGRLRVNASMQRGSVALALRLVRTTVPEWESLGLPDVAAELAVLPRGLVLVTGPTGSGKSTTLAAMIAHLDARERRHVVTIEDPIEFVHEGGRCLVSQRELGADTPSFAAALKHVLRQDPDVILVGEMRDRETIALALTAAETGHLVLSTLHAVSATQTVDRILDAFPADEQQQLRMQLSMVLAGVLSQTLVPRADGQGRVAAFEVLLANAAVRNLLREGKTFQIPNVLRTASREGMCTLDEALARLCRDGLVSTSEAAAHCVDRDEFERLLHAGGLPARPLAA